MPGEAFAGGNHDSISAEIEISYKHFGFLVASDRGVNIRHGLLSQLHGR